MTPNQQSSNDSIFSGIKIPSRIKEQLLRGYSRERIKEVVSAYVLHAEQGRIDQCHILSHVRYALKHDLPMSLLNRNQSSG